MFVRINQSPYKFHLNRCKEKDGVPVSHVPNFYSQVFLKLTDANWEADGGSLLMLGKIWRISINSLYAYLVSGESGSIVRLSVHSTMFEYLLSTVARQFICMLPRVYSNVKSHFRASAYAIGAY
jgi:hypothetical protein